MGQNTYGKKGTFSFLQNFFGGGVARAPSAPRFLRLWQEVLLVKRGVSCHLLKDPIFGNITDLKIKTGSRIFRSEMESLAALLVGPIQ